MSNNSSVNPSVSLFSQLNFPLVIWMILLTILIGLAGGLGANEFVSVYNKGWGYAIGEFALILLPSFVLAAALTGRNIDAASKLAVAASPVAGAGMVCPDTAYATLSPIADKHRLSVAFGSFAGFKLLYPAGPLIVATGLGVNDPLIMWFGLFLLLPIWAIGAWWAKKQSKSMTFIVQNSDENIQGDSIWVVITPFSVLFLLLIIGALFNLSHWPVLDFFTNAKGALLIAAIIALSTIAPEKRHEYLDSAISRTASLLFIIGAASSFGGVLTTVIPVGDFIPRESGVIGIIGLFILTAIFKLVQGSSMATFAAVAPIAAPIVAATTISPISAVFAICLGSFIAILPNDSFYWLVRNNTTNDSSHMNTTLLLAGGSTIQALTGLLILIIFSLTGLV